MRQKFWRGMIFAALLGFAVGPANAADIDDGQAAYNTGDFASALRLWQPLAEQGNPRAENNLGVMYENGRGVPLDYMEAVKWYRLAAAQGYAGAQYNLGLIYTTGRGVSPDPLRAYMWFTLAAMSGDVGALATQSRDVFASAMTPQQIETATGMVRACQDSNFTNCEPAGGIAAGTGPARTTTPAMATTSHDVSAADYPRQSLLLHESGDVTVTYVISESGFVTACSVIITSGNPRLDGAACGMVKRRWRYKPATEDGHPVSIQYISKVTFTRR